MKKFCEVYNVQGSPKFITILRINGRINNKLLLLKMFFEIKIFTIFKIFFVKLYHNNFMALGICQIQISNVHT